jgi:hypothetical protein
MQEQWKNSVGRALKKEQWKRSIERRALKKEC